MHVYTLSIILLSNIRTFIHGKNLSQIPQIVIVINEIPTSKKEWGQELLALFLLTTKFKMSVLLVIIAVRCKVDKVASKTIHCTDILFNCSNVTMSTSSLIHNYLNFKNKHCTRKVGRICSTSVGCLNRMQKYQFENRKLQDLFRN